MTGCAAVGCTNRSERGLALIVFPRDPRRRALWAAKLKRLDWTPNNNSRLCEVHFDNDQWKDPGPNGKKKLKPDAVPTIFSYVRPATKRKLPSRSTIQSNKKARFDSSNSTAPKGDDGDTAVISQLKEELKYQKQLSDNLQLENNALKRKLKNKIAEISRLKAKANLHYLTRKNHYVFNDDQLKALKYKSISYKKWSNQTVQTALGLRFSCGTSGYNRLLAIGLPFPSVRTLQRRVENVKFESGILHEVLDFMKIKILTFQTEQEKEAVLLIDEMALSQSIDYDVSTGSYLGQVTYPNCQGKAKDALVFMIGGISTRWKQTVAYYFTNSQSDGKLLRGLILQVIKEVEDIGLKINAVTSDMGGNNQAMWKEFGITYGKIANKNYVTHPEDPNRKLYFLADPPHLLKNIRTSLINNSHFLIPESIKLKYLLPSNIVTSEHLNTLIESQKDADLKLAPKLTENHLRLNHFNKMKVGMAHNVMSHSVSSGLEFLSEAGKDIEMKTTAWFIEKVSKWFDLMSSRHFTLALSKLNPTVYQETISFLQEMMVLFKELEVVQKDGQKRWKPFQTGALLSTASVLNMEKYYLEEKKFKFLLISRFSQDSLENLFSVVRFRQSVPTALEFKNNLKLITIAQFMTKSTSTNYEQDDRELLSGFLDVISESPPKPAVHTITIPKDWDKNLTELSLLERNCLYNIAGYVVKCLCTLNVCDTCISSLGSKNINENENSKLVEIREFKKNCLFYVNNDIFELFLLMEQLFRSLEDSLLQMKDCKTFLKTQIQEQNFVKSVNLPECHNIKEKLLNKFLVCRLKIFGVKKRKEILKSKKSNIMKSKSIAMHSLADELKTN